MNQEEHFNALKSHQCLLKIYTLNLNPLHSEKNLHITLQLTLHNL